MPPTNMIQQMNKYIKTLKTPIAIVGMGKSGEAAQSLLLQLGVSQDSIFTFDAKLETAQYKDPQDLMSQVQPQTLIVSPGVPLSLEWIQKAKASGIKITSELSLACSCLTTEKLIGVTGSVGKSTTVSILGAGLEAFSKVGFVGGNLGTPFSLYATEVLSGKRPRADWAVLELSSYQLENCENLNLEFSAITYLTSNHLERYESLEDYYQTKWNIHQKTKQLLFLNSEGGDVLEYSKNKISSVPLCTVSKKDPSLQSLQLQKALLIGQHNQDNLALAASIAMAAAWPSEAIQGMKSFKGLVHRLENLGKTKEIRFINDSKATAMDSVLIAAAAAADTLDGGGRLHLLLGGRNKSLPWQDLATLKTINSLQAVFFGECREIAQEKSKLPGPSFAKLELALDYILSTAKPKDTVLLSPGGTSLDEFKSFEDRGDFFKRKIEAFAKT